MYDPLFNSGALLYYKTSAGVRFIVIINHKNHLDISNHGASFISHEIDLHAKCFARVLQNKS
jgi:hypothetical protein